MKRFEKISIRYICVLSLLFMTGCNHDKEPSVLNGNDLIYINDGAIQCETEGMTTTESAQLLINKGIDVISSYCGFLTGIEAATQCGLGDTNINIHEINSQNVPDAQEVGFEPVSTLKQETDIGYQIIECPE
ncbi:hypothetical protein ACFL2V_21595 [Pseudomonadota bacterium]